MTMPKTFSSAEENDVVVDSIPFAASDIYSAADNTDLQVKSNQANDDFTMVYQENSTASGRDEDFVFNDCVQFDTTTSLPTFIDPDPRLLYLCSSSSRSKRSSGEKEKEKVEEEGGVHSAQWWGLRDCPHRTVRRGTMRVTCDCM